MPLLISLNAAKPSNCSVNPSHSMAKGLCKVTETGYVVMCDRALPGERFIGRITRKKGNYAEATKLQTLTPPFHTVDAPCVYVPHCGGCKTHNLAYQAQVKAKEEQVRDLIIHVGRFSQKELELHGIMKPIVPCDIQFHYRNKMEFSFGPYKWLPKELLHGGNVDGGSENYALGLHVPGFFDKIINVDKCLLQTDPANKVLTAIQECCRDPQLGFSPYNVHSHVGFLNNLMLRSGRYLRKSIVEITPLLPTESDHRDHALHHATRNTSARNTMHSKATPTVKFA
ncbi:hypothetical protein RYX36_001556 [Vicia faba]